MPNYASGAKKKKVKEVSEGSDKKSRGDFSKKKVTAVSASQLGADGSVIGEKKPAKKSAKQVLAEYQASEAERRRVEREASTERADSPAPA